MDSAGVKGNPDGKIDRNRLFFDVPTGFLIFPDRRPFDTDVGYAVNDPGALLDRRLLKSTIPRVRMTDAQHRRTALRYACRPIARAFSLGHFAILPQSETVTRNGSVLLAEQDSRIDYETGMIEIEPHFLCDPDVDLTICYEYGP